MRKLIARWNPARDVWETETTGLFCEHSDVYSATWPSSVMTVGFVAYELPMSGHRMDGSESSSLLGTPRCSDGIQHDLRNPEVIGNARARLEDQVALLPTPEASDSTGTRVSSEVGGVRPSGAKRAITLATRVDSLLPTPRATDGTKGGPNQRGSSGDLMLPSAVQLLPTPTTRDHTVSTTAQDAATRSASTTDLATPVLPPTPTTRDRKGANQRGDDTCLHGALLPTPTATPYGNNQSASPGAAVRPSLDSLAPMLLPTPRASDTGTPGRRASEGWRPPLSQVLLPTPTAQAAKHAADDRGPGTLDDCNLWSVAARLGASTNPRFDDGNSDSDD